MHFGTAFFDETTKIAARIVAHIDGPSGSGKTTLAKRLAQLYPHLSIKDLDHFHSPNPDWTKKIEGQQAALHRWVGRQRKPVVLVGIHAESWDPGQQLSFPASTSRIRLNTGPLRSAWRRYRRQPDRTIRDIWRDYQTNRKDIRELDARGYAAMSPNEIVDHISRIGSKA